MKASLKTLKLILPFSFATVMSTLAVSQEINRQRTIKNFVSPNHVAEQCMAIAKLPSANYKASDIEREEKLCNIDFYSAEIALCPKTWSTSPGTIVSSFQGLATSVSQAETLCKYKTPLATEAKFKQSMNQTDTSATFSASPILYYHLSRVLDTTVGVPVAVYRTMDKDAHYQRVTSKFRSSNSRMNVAGWSWMKKAETDSANYNMKSDLLTNDLTQIYGTLLKESGAHYGAEIIGVKDSSIAEWTALQQTPAILALKTKGALEASIETGIQTAFKNPAMKTAFASVAPSKPQMVLWMNELSETAVLDYMLSQQDRMDNIDYKWHWAYVDEEGHVKTEEVKEEAFKSLGRTRMGRIPVPAALAGKNPVLVQRSWINDNDAGGRSEYANYAKSKGLLFGAAGVTEPIAHMNPKLYKKVLDLAADFKTKGPNFEVLNSEARLIGLNDAKDRRFSQLINNTIMLADLLQKNYQAGILKLDLVSFSDAVKGKYLID